MSRTHPTLALDEAERKQAGQLLTDFLDRYERSIPDSPWIVPDVDRDLLARLLTEPFPDKGIGVERLFAEITDTVVPNSTVVAHPRFLAYVLPPPNGIAPYAEAIAAALNQNCNFWQISPAASVIERSVVTWLAGLVGHGDTAGGILTSGGSMATLDALTVALHDRRGDFRRRGLQDTGRPLTVYTSTEAHRCVEKAMAILGLGVDNLRMIPTDRDYRMRVDLLEQSIRDDRFMGLEPFCVVATAGTVATGSIDPIDEIAGVCRAENLWLHVDGAYGALFALSDHRRDAFAACAHADSVALDPHKMLFAPLEAGCLIVRDARMLRAAYSFAASYLTGNDTFPMLSYMDYGPQLSRGFKAFKVWSALRAFGVRAFRDAIDQTLDLAGYLAERVDAEPNLRRMAPVPLSAVCFEVAGAEPAEVLNTLAQEGTALLGPVTLNGRTGIRACVANFRTTRADIDLIVDRLVRLGNSNAPKGIRPYRTSD